MSECDRMRDALGAYVLGALDVEEAARVHRHLLHCSECAAERDSLAPLPELLTLAGGAHAATAEPLPAAFEERLLDAYARDRSAPPPPRTRLHKLRRMRRTRWMAAAGAAAAVAAAAVVAVAVVGGDDEQPQYNLAMQNTAQAPNARAYGTLESGPRGTEVHLWVRGLPGGNKAVYEVMCDAPGWSASAGTFRVNAEGRAYVILNTALRRGEYDAIRVVLRSYGAGGKVQTRDVLRADLS
jgi:putative zinc finger protein